MKNGILVYQDTYEGTNIGDYIQSLAAAQFLPTIDYFVNREQLDLFQKEDIRLIMNGWFTHHPEHWIPSKYIHPLFVAFHINASHKDKILSPEGIEYLKQNQPIGCRDIYTTELLNKYGIDAYYSSCMTLTLDKKYKVNNEERSDEILIVDPLFNVKSFKEIVSHPRHIFSELKNGWLKNYFTKRKFLSNIFDKDIIKKASLINHQIINSMSHQERFDYAETLIKRYARAKLVITSRIHCALPCLALNTPVIFINSFHDISNKSRLNGLIDLFNRIDVNLATGEYSCNFNLPHNRIESDIKIQNPDKYIEYSAKLKQVCNDFVQFS